jgi:glucose-1-phosphate thymidylyltransferase
MDIILPVAGLGTRLRPQTWSKPKPLVSLAGKTILEHVLDRVLPTDPARIVFITGYLGSHIEAWARQHVRIPVEFVEQTEMRGQTDAIIRARDISRDDALILFPDMLFEADFSVIDRTDADVIMFTKEVEDPSALGIAVVENGRIVKLVEKPKEPVSKLAVIGIYYIRSMPALYEAIDEQIERGIKTKNEYFIADAIQIMINKGAKVISEPVTLWEDCGNAASLLSTNRILLTRDGDRGQVETRGNSLIIHPSTVDDTAVLDRSIVGPFASVGERCNISNSLISDSIIEDDACVESCQIVESIIGFGAKVEGRSATINVGDVSTISL